MSKPIHSKSSIFLMELIIAILFFSIASAICMQLFVKAHVLSKNTKELNNAVIICESLAEAFRGTDGDFNEFVALYENCTTTKSSMTLYYDKNFNHCDEVSSYYYAKILYQSDNNQKQVEISYIDSTNNNLIYSLNINIHAPLSSND